MKKIILTLIVVAAVQLGYSQQTKSLLTAYMGFKDALVADDNSLANEKALEFRLALESQEDFQDKSRLTRTIKKAENASIEKQREALVELSEIMWSMVRKSDIVNDRLYYQYCPMKEANWISMDSAIQNPYYGASMISCGKTTEKKP